MIDYEVGKKMSNLNIREEAYEFKDKEMFDDQIPINNNFQFENEFSPPIVSEAYMPVSTSPVRIMKQNSSSSSNQEDSIIADLNQNDFSI